MSKLFFTSSTIKKEENKMAKKEKIEKENLSEIMNLVRAEEVMCYDKETGKCILLENLEAISQQEEGKVWIFPYDMELCSKEKGLRWFIEEYNIDIPDYRKRWQYLRESGSNQAFYEYLLDLRLDAMKDWLHEHNILQLDFDE